MSKQSTKSLIALAWRNIWRHKRRTNLTLAGIAFSCFLFVFATPVQYGAFDSMIDLSLRMFMGHAQVQREGYLDNPQMSTAIDDASTIAEGLRATGKYDAIGIRIAGFALVSSEKRSYGTQVLGVETKNEHTISGLPDTIKDGDFLSADDAPELVIGRALARNLKVDVGDELTLLGAGMDGSVAASILKIVGIFESGDDQLDRFMVEIPIKTFQSMYSMGESAHMIIVSAKNPNDRDILPMMLSEDIPANSELVAVSWEELLPGLKEMWNMKKGGGLIFMLILTVVVVFSIFNTFLMSILERTKEFGLMLALGAMPRNIIRMVMTESFMISVLGLVAGLAISLPLVLYLAQTGFMYPGVEDILDQYNVNIDKIFPQVNLFNILLGPAIIFVSTNLAAWIPILRIRRLKPVDAMRTV
ncbi:MAG: FtsX-like permease family protein [Gammaproteobacteria bacterium]|nr:FtsX-like permease family protein [Gammaproteobacteria bacterium]